MSYFPHSSHSDIIKLFLDKNTVMEGVMQCVLLTQATNLYLSNPRDELLKISLTL